MKGAERRVQEGTKDFIVRYFEDRGDDILLAIQVIDAAASSRSPTAGRRGGGPSGVELFEFLTDLDLAVAVAANKMDRVEDPDATLDAIGERLGMLPPWSQLARSDRPHLRQRREYRVPQGDHRFSLRADRPGVLLQRSEAAWELSSESGPRSPAPHRPLLRGLRSGSSALRGGILARRYRRRPLLPLDDEVSVWVGGSRSPPGRTSSLSPPGGRGPCCKPLSR